jgi:hypothetical protein
MIVPKFKPSCNKFKSFSYMHMHIWKRVVILKSKIVIQTNINVPRSICHEAKIVGN